MNTVLSDLVPTIMNHPELPMGQAIAIAQDLHTKSLIADEVRKIENPFPEGQSVKANSGKTIFVRNDNYSGFQLALQTVLKLIEAKE